MYKPYLYVMYKQKRETKKQILREQMKNKKMLTKFHIVSLGFSYLFRQKPVKKVSEATVFFKLKKYCSLYLNINNNNNKNQQQHYLHFYLAVTSILNNTTSVKNVTFFS